MGARRVRLARRRRALISKLSRVSHRPPLAEAGITRERRGVKCHKTELLGAVRVTADKRERSLSVAVEQVDGAYEHRSDATRPGATCAGADIANPCGIGTI